MNQLNSFLIDHPYYIVNIVIKILVSKRNDYLVYSFSKYINFSRS